MQDEEGGSESRCRRNPGCGRQQQPPASFRNSAVAATFHNRTTLNRGEDDEFECRGFRLNPLRAFIVHLSSLILLGVPYLLGRWRPQWTLRWMCNSCCLRDADRVLIQPSHPKGTGGGSASAVAFVIVAEAPEDAPPELVHVQADCSMVRIIAAIVVGFPINRNYRPGQLTAGL